MRISPLVSVVSISVSLLVLPYLNGSQSAWASDHGDSPTTDQDQGADIADGYLFLDPANNNKVVLEMTVHGFIVPGEATNFATFDPRVRYIFNIENTGDAIADERILVRFSEKTASTSSQIATVTLPDGTIFTAPTTPVTFAAKAEPFVVTYKPVGVEFFAGEVDDPFFFDLVAFNEFVASVKAKAPDASVFSRGRDSFAGYNVLGIALELPAKMLRGTGKIIGMDLVTERGTQTPSRDGGFTVTPPYRVVDRAGNPAINTALIPYADKDLYNASTPEDDAAGKFVPDIEATLALFGTNSTYVTALYDIAVAKGDYLHLDLSTRNAGPGGGTSAGSGFPNGRRLSDDVIDFELTAINNGTHLGDNVDHNDVPFTNTFPFFAPAHQPRNAGVINDDTQN